MFDFLQKYLFRSIMYIFYNYYKNNLWTIYSDAPTAGNIAFPDFSVNYYVSFLTQKNIQISGYIPSNVNFFSITIYDTDADTIYYFDDNKVDKYVKNQFYSLVIRDLPRAYCIIVRYYLKQKDTIISESEFYGLPRIMNIDNSTYYSQSSLKERKQNTDSLVSYYTYFVSKRNFLLQSNYNEFKLPINPIQMYFPNKKALYSTLRVKSIDDVIIIRGQLPIINRTTNIRFIGFMLCNYLTTETDNSISNDLLNTNFVLYITSTLKNATRYNYDAKNENHSLLLWNKNNIYPIVICREVKINNIENEHNLNLSIDVNNYCTNS